jgi:addiction module RelE/StbE family toxin
MARNIRWTRRALGRLDEIAAHIAADSPARATVFVTELRAKVDVLALHLPGRPGRVYGTRELVLHRHYLAVYRVRGEEVHILTVMHTARQRA